MKNYLLAFAIDKLESLLCRLRAYQTWSNIRIAPKPRLQQRWEDEQRRKLEEDDDIFDF